MAYTYREVGMEGLELELAGIEHEVTEYKARAITIVLGTAHLNKIFLFVSAVQISSSYIVIPCEVWRCGIVLGCHAGSTGSNLYNNSIHLSYFMFSNCINNKDFIFLVAP